MTAQTLKQRLTAGEKQLGIVMLLPSPDVAEIVAHSGLDMVMIDHEHGKRHDRRLHCPGPVDDGHCDPRDRARAAR
jgi:2-keto-3-deoxy-L-rhamnonate aldolase RhmA